VSDESKAKVQKFLQRDKSLREYVTEIEKLKKLKSEVASLPVLIPMHLFLLD
jgi:dynein heavy chain